MCVVFCAILVLLARVVKHLNCHLTPQLS